MKHECGFVAALLVDRDLEIAGVAVQGAKDFRFGSRIDEFIHSRDRVDIIYRDGIVFLIADKKMRRYIFCRSDYGGWSPFAAGWFYYYFSENFIDFVFFELTEFGTRVVRMLENQIWVGLKLDTMYGSLDVAEVTIPHVGEWF